VTKKFATRHSQVAAAFKKLGKDWVDGDLLAKASRLTKGELARTIKELKAKGKAESQSCREGYRWFTLYRLVEAKT